MTETNPNATDSTGREEWAQIFKGRLGLYSLMLNLGILLYAIDTLIVVTILPTLVEDIGGTQFYSWTIMLFMVGSIIGAGGAGPARDMFGPRQAYVYAGLVFAAGNLGAGLAPNIGALLAWRTVQGLGGGLIIAQSYGLVGAMFPPLLRPRILAVVSTTWGIATVLGPGFGGVFAEFGWWQGAFFALVPLALIFIGLAWKFVPISAGHGSVARLPIKRLTAMAASILGAGLTSQIDNNWARLALLIAAVGLVAYAVRRDVKAADRMFPTHTFALNTVIGAAHWAQIFMILSFMVSVIYVTLFLQLLHGQTPIIAGYISGLVSLSWSLAAVMVAGFKGRAVWHSVVAGTLVVLAGSVGLLIFGVSGPVIAIAVALIVVGAGVGAQNNLYIALSIEAATPGEETLTASSVQIIRTLGVAFASAIAGLVANAAGMADNAPLATVATAVNWVYGANLMIAVLGVLFAINFHHRGRQTRRGEAATTTLAKPD